VKYFYLKRGLSRLIDIFLLLFFISTIFSILEVSGIKLEKILLIIFMPDYSFYIDFRFPYLSWIIHLGQTAMLVTFLSAFFLAMLMTVFGMTPGKAAMGLRICAPAERTSFFSRFGFFLAREMRVWLSGLGFGFLWLSPFFILWQALRIRGGKPAFYDRYEPAVFNVKKLPVVPFLSWMLLTVFLIVLIGAQIFRSFLILRESVRFLDEVSLACSQEKNNEPWSYTIRKEILCSLAIVKRIFSKNYNDI